MRCRVFRLSACMLTVFLMSAASAAELRTQRIGAFELSLDPDDAWLPRGIAVEVGGGSVALLDAKLGLNFTFTDFRLRNKFYREESRGAWPGKDEPRFVTEPRDLSEPKAIERGVEVSYRTSFAAITRRIVAAADGVALRIEYEVTPAKDLLVHEPGMFGFGLKVDAGFTGREMVDARTDTPAWMGVDDTKLLDCDATAHHGGPVLFTHAGSGVKLLIEPHIPADATTRMWTIPAGKTVTFAADLTVFKADDPQLPARTDAALKQVDGERRPFALTGLARMLMASKKLKDAEQALLLAARLDEEFATPYTLLAQMRNGHHDATQIDGGMTFGQAWVEAAYRMPYNYGYILSGSSFPSDKRLTEPQRRQAIFNLLIAVENTTFYPDYYIWVARHFEAMKMYSQAAAMHRQALWALTYLPRPEKYKQDQKQKLEKKLAELEAKLLTEETVLPELIRVDVAPPK